jgi:hypothetical protein
MGSVHTPTEERLLTREQIAALTVIADIEAIQDEVLDTIKQIEVDLEFRADDRADEDWEHRARRALAAHHVCSTRLGQRIRQLQRADKKAPTPPNHDAKARKKEAEAARLLAAAENKRMKAAEEREKTIRQLVSYASRQSLLLHFHAAAREHLPIETYARLMAIARAENEASLMGDLSAQGIEARSDETPQAAQPAGQEPDPEGDAPDSPIHHPNHRRETA